MENQVSINGVDIGGDGEGRFSLNDLHSAAGGLNSQKPSLFYRSGSFEKVVQVLKAQNSAFEPIVKKRGRHNGGTWVCKELVYKYAMWVSADFEVKVIQTFDSVGRVQDSMLAMNDLVKRIEQDKDAASFCGKELARYKKIKLKNEQDWKNAVAASQLQLGFGGE